MQRYKCIKTVKAKPLTRGDYIKLRGWELPADENGADLGYLVEDMKTGDTNCKGFKGYVYWVPAEQFKRYYKAV